MANLLHKLISLNLQKDNKTSETGIGASVILRRVTSLELTLYGMRRVIWLQTATVFSLGGGNVSLSCSMYMGLVMLGRHKYTQLN
jgi:hypothetical protein